MTNTLIKRDYTPGFCYESMLEDPEQRAKKDGQTVLEFAKKGKKANSKLAKAILKEISKSDDIDYIEELIGEYIDTRTNQHLLKRFRKMYLSKELIANIEEFKENANHKIAIDGSIFYDTVVPELTDKEQEQMYDLFSRIESLDIFDSGEPVFVTADDLDAIIDDFKCLLNYKL